MTKRKTGNFDMTGQECALFNESMVQGNLAAHYQSMADKYNEAYVRMLERFWTEVKKRDLPENCNMSVNHGDRKLTITKTNIVRAEMEK